MIPTRNRVRKTKYHTYYCSYLVSKTKGSKDTSAELAGHADLSYFYGLLPWEAERSSIRCFVRYSFLVFSVREGIKGEAKS